MPTPFIKTVNFSVVDYGFGAGMFFNMPMLFAAYDKKVMPKHTAEIPGPIAEGEWPLKTSKVLDVAKRLVATALKASPVTSLLTAVQADLTVGCAGISLPFILLCIVILLSNQNAA